MTKYEKFEEDVMAVAPAEVVPNCHFSLMTTEEGAKRQIPEPHIREMLISMCKRELIHLSIFDGQRECSIQEWLTKGQNQDSFFYNRTDSGRVRIRLLLAGAAYRDMPKRGTIGFVAGLQA